MNKQLRRVILDTDTSTDTHRHSSNSEPVSRTDTHRHTSAAQVQNEPTHRPTHPDTRLPAKSGARGIEGNPPLGGFPHPAASSAQVQRDGALISGTSEVPMEFSERSDHAAIIAALESKAISDNSRRLLQLAKNAIASIEAGQPVDRPDDIENLITHCLHEYHGKALEDAVRRILIEGHDAP